MKKNGFTLVEVLAVVVIIAILALITIPIIDRVMKDGREGAYASTISTILDAAYDYVQIKPGLLPDADSTTTFTLGEIKKEGLLKKDLKNPKTGAQFSDSCRIQITMHSEYTAPLHDRQKFFGNYLFEFIES